MSAKFIKSLDELRLLNEVSVENIVEHAEEEVITILCLIAILPFMQPIPIPGLSSILGFIVLLQGIGLMLLEKPLLTKRLKQISIGKAKFEKIYKAAKKLSKITSKLSVLKHPITNTRFFHFLSGFSIVVAALFLSLPLPVPFSNLVPALSIFLVCIGLLEDDLLLALLGICMTGAVVWMAIQSMELIGYWASKFL